MFGTNWFFYLILIIAIPIALLILYLVVKVLIALIEGTLHKIRSKVKYESELDQDFAREISYIPGGETLFSCIQCGTCSATCPMSIYMDYTPRRIVAMTRAGFKDEVLRSFTIWLCTSCYSCSVRCPRNLKITDFMYALKQRAIQEKFYPKRFPIPALAREFFRSILKRGRNSEIQLVTFLYLKTNPLQILKYTKMGIKLFLRGRISIKPQSIPGKPAARKEIKKILGAV
ncbi:MAG: 4Fe-4S dicluster domain-containing protein [Candidatus Aminicenantes bacterium]|nr:MAG: 4Fe-4S dicluster domain-containing protein [Candidatus Aminicenantes bacterium]